MQGLNRRIRVAHVITNFVLGGAQDYLFMVVRGLDRSKFEPIIAGRMEGEWTDVVKTIPDSTWVDIPSLRREVSPFHDVSALFQIRKLCRELDVDIVHTHSSKPGILGRFGATLAGVPGIVHTIHGFSFHNFMPPWKRALFAGLERAMSPFTTSLLVLSEEDRRTAERFKIGSKKSVEMFYYGIDYTPFEAPVDRQNIRSAFGITKENFVVGFTGRFSEQKGLHILVEAFSVAARSFPELRLLLVGDGSLRPQLVDQICRLGISDKVIITGFRSDIPALLRSMDGFVMTSLWEGLSRSLAEAMYARLPVIATDVGGTSDAVQNGVTGWLIPANDVSAAAAALREMVRNPVDSRNRAEAGYRWARERFDVSRMIARLEELYSRIVQESRLT